MRLARQIPWSKANRENSWAAVALLALAVLGPTICLLWLVRKATQNEALAVQQIVADSNANQLATSLFALDNWLSELETAVSKIRSQTHPYNLGYEVAEAGLADSATVWPLPDEDFVFPFNPPPQDFQDRIREANMSTNNSVSELISLYEEATAKGYRTSQGRLLAPLIALAALGRTGEKTDLAATELLQALRESVAQHRGPPIPPAQRRFLLESLREWDESAATIRSLATERKAESGRALIERSFNGSLPEGSVVSNDFVLLGFPEESVGLVFEKDRFSELVEEALQRKIRLQGRSLTFNYIAGGEKPPEREIAGRNLSRPFIGWRLSLVSPVGEAANALQGSRGMTYSWISGFAIVLSLAFAGVTVILMRKQANVAQLKNELVATVTHELKTPIASTRLLVDTLLADNTADQAKTRDYLELIARENTRLGLLIENFLSFSRMERGWAPFEMQACSPHAIVQDIAMAFRERFSNRDYDLQIDAPLDLAPIMADAEAIQTALGNLLENALKYGGNPPKILIHVRNRGTFTLFEVSDNGLGIPPREHEKVFKRFYQAEANGHRSGVGLGLTIVSFIVEKHGGKVEIASEPDRGSTFGILLKHA